MAQLRLGYPEIERSGAEVLQITHNTAAEAQRYFKHYPIAFPYLCDADRVVHEAYGLQLEAPKISNAFKTMGAVAADFVTRGERTPPPISFLKRTHGQDSPQAVLVAMNNGESGASLVLRAPELAGMSWSPAAIAGLSRLADETVAADGVLRLELPPRSGVLLRAVGRRVRDAHVEHLPVAVVGDVDHRRHHPLGALAVQR